MSYNSELQSNNSDLQTILNIVNTLPDANGSGGVELPELENPATAADMVLGKSLYDSDGNLVTGNVLEKTEGSLFTGIEPSELYFINNKIRVTGVANINSRYDGALLRTGSNPRLFIEASEFGDATRDDVKEGVFFTSAAGLLVEGTLAERKPGDEGRYIFRTNARVSGGTGLLVEAESSPSAASIIHRPGSTATIQISSEVFGNAAADQVAKGATFTSEVGLLTEGELEEILAGASIGSNEDISVKRYDNGTIRIIGKTNWGDGPDCIVRSGAYLNITAKESDFDGIFGSGVDVSVDGETLVITGAVIVDNETLIL